MMHCSESGSSMTFSLREAEEITWMNGINFWAWLGTLTEKTMGLEKKNKKKNEELFEFSWDLISGWLKFLSVQTEMCPASDLDHLPLS